MPFSVELSTKLIKCLLDADSTSDFLQKSLFVLRTPKRKVSFADLSRKMGFSSRSFVRLLFLGERKPNLTNYRQISQGLGLTKEATHYFGLLLEKEQLEFKHRRSLDAELAQSKIKLHKFLQKKSQLTSTSSFLPYEKWPFIYAALGTTKKGHTLQEIAKLSGETPEKCSEILQLLISRGIATFDEKSNCYRPIQEVLEFGELGQNTIFKRLYQNSTIKTISRIERDFNNPQTLFYTSVFSVKKKDLVKLAKSLQELLQTYTSEAENSEGDELAILSTALVPIK